MLTLQNYIQFLNNENGDKFKIMPTEVKIEESYEDLNRFCKVRIDFTKRFYQKYIKDHLKEGLLCYVIGYYPEKISEDTTVNFRLSPTSTEETQVNLLDQLKDVLLFVGIITKINTTEHYVDLIIEDSLYFAKNTYFNQNFNDMKLYDVIKEVVEKTNIENSGKMIHFMDYSFRVWDLQESISINIKKNISAFEILKLLKDRYKGIKIFMRYRYERYDNLLTIKDQILHVGWADWENKRLDYNVGYISESNVDYSLTYDYVYYPQILDGNKHLIISAELKDNEVDKDRVLFVLNGVEKDTNKKLEVQYPKNLLESNADEVKTVNFESNLTKSEMENIAQEMWEDYEPGRKTGKVKMFGYPVLRHGDKINLTVGKKSMERFQGEYIIKSITKRINQNGFFQEAEIKEI